MTLSPVPVQPPLLHRIVRAPLGAALTIFVLSACQGEAAVQLSPAHSIPVAPYAPMAEVSQAAVSNHQGTPTVEEKAPGASEAQGPAEVAPKYTPEDPSDWESVTEIGGVPVETVRSTFASGKLRRIHTQMVGVIGPFGHHGRDLQLHENGALKQETYWVQGKLEGSYTEWFEGGQIKISSQHKNGLRTGTFKEYGERGVLRVQGEYLQGRLNGEFRQWFGGGANQELSHWDKGVQTGLYRIWLKGNVPIKAEYYSDGILNGLAKTFHPIADEELVRTVGEYVNGAQEGEWLEYDVAGNIVNKKYFVQGALQGAYEEWKSGVMVLRTNYTQGLEEGAREEFYLSGKPFASGQMKSGLREGPWKYWEEDGRLQDKWSGVYQAGKRIADLPASDESKGESAND